MNKLDLMTNDLAETMANLNVKTNRVEIFRKTLESFANFAISEWQVRQFKDVSADLDRVERIRQGSK
jgi:hypothetical protein